MGNKLIIIVIMSLACGIVSAWEIEDVNGTWVYCEEFLKSNRIYKTMYSWGMGRRIVETSIEFDLGQKTVMIPGDGMHTIDTVFQEEEGTICLKLFSVEEFRNEIPLYIKVRFIDTERAYIECDHWEIWQDRTYSPEEKWVWYRLSGPAGNLTGSPVKPILKE